MGTQFFFILPPDCKIQISLEPLDSQKSFTYQNLQNFARKTVMKILKLHLKWKFFFFFADRPTQHFKEMKKILVSQFFHLPTDSPKMARRKSAILKINRPWPNQRTNPTDFKLKGCWPVNHLAVVCSSLWSSSHQDIADELMGNGDQLLSIHPQVDECTSLQQKRVYTSLGSSCPTCVHQSWEVYQRTNCNLQTKCIYAWANNKRIGVRIQDRKYLNRCTPFLDVSLWYIH